MSEKILVFKNEFHDDHKLKFFKGETIDGLFIPHSIVWHEGISVSYMQYRDRLINEIFEEPITMIPNLYIKEREEVENDPAYSQIIATVIIEDQFGNLVLLKNINHSEEGMEGQYSLIGGHCTASKYMWDKPLEQIIAAEAMRELLEEVIFDEDVLIDIDSMVLYDIIHKCDEDSSMRHCGVVFKIMAITNLLKHEILSKEPEKHSVEIVNKYITDETVIDSMDTWVRWYLAQERRKESKKDEE